MRLPTCRIRRGLVYGVAVLAAFSLPVLGSAPASFAGTVTGTVTNGTTGKLAVGADVILLALQGGMEAVANTKTDSQGQFHFEHPQLGVAPMLIRVAFKGVNYHQPAAPGQNNLQITVYDPTTDPSAFSVGAHFIVFQPKDSNLLVGEEFNIQNQTQPPKTYYQQSGTFSFFLPKGAQLQQVSALGPGGMPVQQGTIDKGNNQEAIDFPFRPGETDVRVSYVMPYTDNQAMVHTKSPFSAARVLLVAPPPMQILSEGFSPSGTEQGFNVYTRDSVAANVPLNISVSGTAPSPANSGDNSAQSTQSAASQTAQVIPGRMDNVKWMLVVGLAAIFALGGAMLLRQRSATAVAAGPAASAPPASPAVSAAIDQANQAVKGSLDEIKDRLFRLELRRQAGTISEEDYTRQRAAAEAVLRDLLRG